MDVDENDVSNILREQEESQMSEQPSEVNSLEKTRQSLTDVILQPGSARGSLELGNNEFNAEAEIENEANLHVQNTNVDLELTLIREEEDEDENLEQIPPEQNIEMEEVIEFFDRQLAEQVLKITIGFPRVAIYLSIAWFCHVL